MFIVGFSDKQLAFAHKFALDRQEMRIKAMKKGKGEIVVAVGVAGWQEVVEELGVAYVKAKAVVQMRYQAAGSELAAVGRFLSAVENSNGDLPRTDANGANKNQEDKSASQPGAAVPQVNSKNGVELLVLDDRLSDRALERHEKAWERVNPEEYIVAGRAVGLVVHPQNRLDSLTVGQIRMIFSGEIDNWQLLGGEDKKINCYGLRSTDSNGEAFFTNVLAASKCKGLKSKKDSAEVLAALATDPDGIGFIDFSAFDEKQAVKLLGVGPKDKAQTPTAEAVRTAMYPLATRMFLYVSPKASQTTQDFVKFLVAGGGKDAYEKTGCLQLMKAQK
jgi:phosphate transport system substrate-binding protein